MKRSYPYTRQVSPASALLVADQATLTHTEQAYETIKRRIIQLELPPGSQFTEGQLAAIGGTSKTPVREALVRLQRDGLVDALPRSGYRVAPVTLKDTRDLCEFRRSTRVRMCRTGGRERHS